MTEQKFAVFTRADFDAAIAHFGGPRENLRLIVSKKQWDRLHLKEEYLGLPSRCLLFDDDEDVSCDCIVFNVVDMETKHCPRWTRPAPQPEVKYWLEDTETGPALYASWNEGRGLLCAVEGDTKNPLYTRYIVRRRYDGKDMTVNDKRMPAELMQGKTTGYHSPDEAFAILSKRVPASVPTPPPVTPQEPEAKPAQSEAEEVDEYEYTHAAVIQLAKKGDPAGETLEIPGPDMEDGWEEEGSLDFSEMFLAIEQRHVGPRVIFVFNGESKGYHFKHLVGQLGWKEYVGRVAAKGARLLSIVKYRRDKSYEKPPEDTRYFKGMLKFQGTR